jgi:hypothetical protein
LADVNYLGEYGSANFFNADGSALSGVVAQVPILQGIINATYRVPKLTDSNATGGTAVIKSGLDEANRVPTTAAKSCGLPIFTAKMSRCASCS